MKERFSVSSFMNPSPKEIMDFLDTRLIIETAACEQAVDHMTLEVLAEIKNNYHNMSLALNHSKRFIFYDMEFHQAILAAGGNTILPKVFGLIQDLFSKQLLIFAGYPKGLDKALDFHRRILDGLIERDKAKAAGAMKDHILDMKTSLESRLAIS